jgi:hypothetical protein
LYPLLPLSVSIAGLLLILPLWMTAMSGALYTVYRYYLRAPKADLSFLLSVHQGSAFTSPVLYTAVMLALFLASALPGALLLPFVTAWRNGRGGARRGRDPVRYTMLDVKRAFEGGDSEMDEDGPGSSNRSDRPSSGSDAGGGQDDGVELLNLSGDDSDEDEEDSQHSALQSSRH